MGSTEETTSATQPLISTAKPYSSILDETSPHHSPSHSEPDPTEYLHIAYSYGPRPVRDLPFLILFSLFVLSTFAFGIFATVRRNPNSSDVSSFIYDFNSTSCVRDTASFRSTGFNAVYFASSRPQILKALIWTLVITSILSVPFSLFVLFLLRRFTKQLVYICLPFFVIISFVIDVYWFVACTVNSSCSDTFPLAYRILVLVFVLLIIGVIVWTIVVNWHRVELTVKIIGVASDALSGNLGLFGVLPGLTLALLVCCAPVVVFLVFANLNGRVVPREKDGEFICVWKQDSWVPAYYALAILTMLWSAAAMVEAEAYVIGGTIAQWYFSRDDSSIKRSIRSSLRLNISGRRN